jgi:hypothetical protein
MKWDCSCTASSGNVTVNSPRHASQKRVHIFYTMQQCAEQALRELTANMAHMGCVCPCLLDGEIWHKPVSKQY